MLATHHAEDVVFHAPGTSPLGGVVRGRANVFARLKRMAELSGGTFEAVSTAMSGNGDFVSLLHHAMFGETLLQIASKVRAGPSQWFSEWVAAFGLVLTILLTLRANAAAVATSVGLYITAAYWFTASTSFANPAVAIARALSNTFAGIRPLDVPAFIVAELLGALLAMALAGWLLSVPKPEPEMKAAQ